MKPSAVLRATALGAVIALGASGCDSVPAGTAGPVTPASPRRPVAAVSQVADAVQLAAGHWSALPLAPIAPRRGASVMWTGAEMLVWGGASGAHDGQLYADGAAYDPVAQTWRSLPPAPLSPRSGQVAVWTGHELVVWGCYTHVGVNAVAVTSSGAAYDPTTNRWRTLAPAPLSPRADALAVWTGTAALILGGQPAVTTASNRSFSDGALYDPRTGRWRHLAGPSNTGGQPLGWVAALQARGELLAWSTWSKTQHVGASPYAKDVGTSTYAMSGGTQLYRYGEATRDWRLLPASPASLPTLEDAIWTGQRAIVRGITYNCGDCPGPFVPEASAIFDPRSNTWTRLPADPLAGDHLSSAWTGAALFSFNPHSINGTVHPGAASAYDPRTNSWQRTSSAPFGCANTTDPLWTGHQILMYCSPGLPGAPPTHGGLAFTPAR